MEPRSLQPKAGAGAGPGVGLRKRQLQCPFTWRVPVVETEVLAQERDTLPLASDTWSLVLSKLFLAYQYAMREDATEGDLKRSRQLLVDCYLPLLRVKGLVNSDSDLIDAYRVALKHVVDATWAFVHFVSSKAKPVRDMTPFLETVTPYPTMNDAQKSAVWGIRGRLAHHDDGLRATQRAIALNPNEGQWHLYRGLLLHQLRIGPRIASMEELRSLKEAYCLRPTPESMVVYAISLTALAPHLRRPNDLKKGLDLLRDALNRWPNNPYVNFECGVAFCKNLTKQEDFILAERCLRNAVKLVNPGKCKIAFTELGVFLINHKDIAEGRMYLQMGKEVSHE